MEGFTKTRRTHSHPHPLFLNIYSSLFSSLLLLAHPVEETEPDLLVHAGPRLLPDDGLDLGVEVRAVARLRAPPRELGRRQQRPARRRRG